MAKVAIVGAGWAGLTAALSLQTQGHNVTVYERSPATHGAGGRASTAYAAGEKTPFALDNGQHVLLGAYAETLALFERLEIDTEQAFLRIPAAWYVPNLLSIALPRWGDSLQPKGVWAKGLFKQLPLALAMLLAKPTTPAVLMARLLAAVRLQFNTPKFDETVSEWLIRLRFPTPFDEALWRPLCYATLNTPPETASATVFKRVIQDGLLAGSYRAAMLVPRVDLGAMLPAVALKKLRTGNAVLKFGCAVQEIAVHSETSKQLSIKAINTDIALFDAVICATTAKDAVRILPNACISTALRQLAAQTPEPITTIHLNVKNNNLHNTKTALLNQAVVVLPEPDNLNNPIRQAVAIDRCYLNASQAGWITLVLSCSGAALMHTHATLIEFAMQRLQQVFPQLQLTSSCLLHGVVIHAKQATFASTADLQRPSARTAYKNIVLAGDYVVDAPPIYPATIEGAVRSGLAAAKVLETHFSNFL